MNKIDKTIYNIFRWRFNRRYKKHPNELKNMANKILAWIACHEKEKGGGNVDYNKLHEKVFTHRCVCGNTVREIKWIGKFIKPCKKCGKTMWPVDVEAQHKGLGWRINIMFSMSGKERTAGMCRKITDKKEQVICSRCGEIANLTDGWEHGWPLYGRIEIGFPAQLFAFLGGAKYIADKEHFEVWNEGHDAMIENGAQEAIFEWGNGYRFDSKGRYRLCYECQKKLLYAIGDFFGIKDRVDAVRKKLGKGIVV